MRSKIGHLLNKSGHFDSDMHTTVYCCGFSMARHCRQTSAISTDENLQYSVCAGVPEVFMKDGTIVYCYCPLNAIATATS